MGEKEIRLIAQGAVDGSQDNKSVVGATQPILQCRYKENACAVQGKIFLKSQNPDSMQKFLKETNRVSELSTRGNVDK